MSYDVFVFKFAQVHSSPPEVPDNAETLPLGSGDEVRASISRVFANTDWQDPTWGIWESEFGSIDFNIGNDNYVTDFAMHIRANDAVIPGLIQLCRDNSWQAMDGEDGFIEQRTQPADALNVWRSYRDQLLK